MFQNKGALVVLLWIFCGFCVLLALYSRTPNAEWKVGSVTINSAVIITPCLLLYPVFGWLADAKFGRYKVIKWSFISLWILAVLISVLSVFQKTLSSTFGNYLYFILYLPVGLALGGVVANMVQFGTDQLADASSVEITRFICWGAWMWFLGSVIGGVTHACFYSYQSLSYILYPTIITLAVSADFILNNWLDKQPLPLANYLIKMVKVLLYAKKHRYPTVMAPHDWDERRSIRLDVSKHEYGGPFSSEEVEDVKTSLRILVIIIVGAFFIGLYVPGFQTYYLILSELIQQKYDASIHDMTFRERFNILACVFSGDILVVIGVPFFEFIVRPLLKLRFSITILQKLLLGVLFANLSMASVMTIALLAESGNPELKNVTCVVASTGFRHTSLDYRGMAIPYTLDSIMEFMLLTSGIEFICAQSPYSMKGLIFGVAYGSVGFFSIFGFLISKGLKRIASNWLFRPVGCTFWYFLLVELLLLFMLLISALLFKYYKKRKRQDKSDHHFAVYN